MNPSVTTISKVYEQSPLVTIAIPTLNRIAYLESAIASALGQTYSALQVIISDNASEDGTRDFLASLRDPRLLILHQDSRLSMVENWNRCLERATGQYFLLLSDDDVLEQHAITEMVRSFTSASDSDLGFVYCRGRVIDGKGEVIGVGQPAPARESAESLIRAFFESRRDLWPCSILFRRSDLPRYTSEFPLGTDAVAWINNAARYGAALFVDLPLVNYRKHQSLTFQTGYAIWFDENVRLAKYAIAEMQKWGRGDRVWSSSILRATQRLNTRLAAAFINQMGRESRSAALNAYCAELQRFRSWYGFRVLIRGLLTLLLPRIITRSIKIRRARRIAPI